MASYNRSFISMDVFTITITYHLCTLDDSILRFFICLQCYTRRCSLCSTIIKDITHIQHVELLLVLQPCHMNPEATTVTQFGKILSGRQSGWMLQAHRRFADRCRLHTSEFRVQDPNNGDGFRLRSVDFWHEALVAAVNIIFCCEFAPIYVKIGYFFCIMYDFWHEALVAAVNLIFFFLNSHQFMSKSVISFV